MITLMMMIVLFRFIRLTFLIDQLFLAQVRSLIFYSSTFFRGHPIDLCSSFRTCAGQSKPPLKNTLLLSNNHRRELHAPRTILFPRERDSFAPLYLTNQGRALSLRFMLHNSFNPMNFAHKPEGPAPGTPGMLFREPPPPQVRTETVSRNVV